MRRYFRYNALDMTPLYGCDVIYGRPENMTLRTEFMKLHFRPKEQVLNTNTLYALLD